MKERQIITDYLHDLLSVDSFEDYCPNGLQVEGGSKISNIVSGVSVSLELITKAIRLNADALLVHHGLFWKGDAQSITGITKNRLSLLLQHNINLLAYHLPLDTHKIYGNNALIAKCMNWTIANTFDLLGTKGLGCYSELENAIDATELAKQLTTNLQREPLYLPAHSNNKIKKVAWCSGGAQDGITMAKDIGADAYISGEVSERTYYLAKELNIHYFAAGHHATEIFGVRALGGHLANKYNLKHSFVNIENPV
jgi:dinuclear metal center YbgI/SA1388 family protein